MSEEKKAKQEGREIEKRLDVNAQWSMKCIHNATKEVYSDFVVLIV